MVYAGQALTRHNVQDNIKTLVHALESEDKDPPSVLVPELGRAAASPNFIAVLFGEAKLHAMMR